MIKPTTDVREGKSHQLELNRQLLSVPFLHGKELTFNTEDRFRIQLNHSLGRPYQGFLQLNGNSGLVEDTSNPDKDRQLWLRMGAPWQLIDEQRVTAAVTDVTFSGLNGDDEQAYRFEIYLVAGAAAAVEVTLQPNGLATNQESVHFTLDPTPAIAAATSATLRIGVLSSASLTDVSYIEGTFYAKSGQERLVFATQADYDSSSTDAKGRSLFGAWSNTSTAVTSLGFNSSAASGFGVGSTFRLYRRAATNQKIKLWVF